MQDDSDQTEADRIHEGYQRRYEKERRASYALVLFGLLSLAAIVTVMFMHRTGMGGGNLANIEPGAGGNTTQIEQKKDNPAAPTRTPDKTQTTPTPNQLDNPLQ
jgi:hypothetical protein